MEDIVIVGCGGQAAETAFLIKRLNRVEIKWNILGFVDKQKNAAKATDYHVLGDDDWLLNYNKKINVAIGVGSPDLKESIVNKLKQNDKIFFPSLIDSSVILSERVTIAEGSIIAAGTILTENINLGSFVTINTGCTVGHDCFMQDFATISPGVHMAGNVYIGKNSYIGIGASIIQGMHIGNNSIIGAGAVVIRNIGDNCTAVGNPARIIKENKVGIKNE